MRFSQVKCERLGLRVCLRREKSMQEHDWQTDFETGWTEKIDEGSEYVHARFFIGLIPQPTWGGSGCSPPSTVPQAFPGFQTIRRETLIIERPEFHVCHHHILDGSFCIGIRFCIPKNPTPPQYEAIYSPDWRCFSFGFISIPSPPRLRWLRFAHKRRMYYPDT